MIQSRPPDSNPDRAGESFFPKRSAGTWPESTNQPPHGIRRPRAVTIPLPSGRRKRLAPPPAPACIPCRALDPKLVSVSPCAPPTQCRIPSTQRVHRCTEHLLAGRRGYPGDREAAVRWTYSANWCGYMGCLQWIGRMNEGSRSVFCVNSLGTQDYNDHPFCIVASASMASRAGIRMPIDYPRIVEGRFLSGFSQSDRGNWLWGPFA